ncbi:MAG: cytochrome b/b6 domain-containing protein [Pseudomonadota bacterium]
MPATAYHSGYTTLSIALHWLGAIAVIALFVTHEGPRGSVAFAFHVSGGAILGILLLWRVFHRLNRGLAPQPAQHGVLNLLARLVTFGFLAAILVVVLTGYLLPWTVGQPIDIYGWISIPSPLSPSRDFHEIMEQAHNIAGHLFPPLLILHVLGALKHAIIDRDGILRSMVRPSLTGK